MGAAGEGLRPFSRFSRFTGRELQMLGINIYYPRYCYGCRKKTGILYHVDLMCKEIVRDNGHFNSVEFDGIRIVLT